MCTGGGIEDIWIGLCPGAELGGCVARPAAAVEDISPRDEDGCFIELGGC